MEELKWPEITKDTPIEEVKRIHQRIWDYVIEHGKKPLTPYIHDCAACEMGFQTSFFMMCPYCPVEWPNNIVCSCKDSLYSRWDRSKFFFMKKNLAKQIRNIPWKFEVNKNEMKKNLAKQIRNIPWKFEVNKNET